MLFAHFEELFDEPTGLLFDADVRAATPCGGFACGEVYALTRVGFLVDCSSCTLSLAIVCNAASSCALFSSLIEAKSSLLISSSCEYRFFES